MPCWEKGKVDRKLWNEGFICVKLLKVCLCNWLNDKCLGDDNSQESCLPWELRETPQMRHVTRRQRNRMFALPSGYSKWKEECEK